MIDLSPNKDDKFHLIQKAIKKYNLHGHPRKWNARQVQQWILWELREFYATKLDLMEVDGVVLGGMSLEGFQIRVPNLAKFLHTEMMLWLKVADLEDQEPEDMYAKKEYSTAGIPVVNLLEDMQNSVPLKHYQTLPNNFKPSTLNLAIPSLTHLPVKTATALPQCVVDSSETDDRKAQLSIEHAASSYPAKSPIEMKASFSSIENPTYSCPARSPDAHTFHSTQATSLPESNQHSGESSRSSSVSGPPGLTPIASYHSPPPFHPFSNFSPRLAAPMTAPVKMDPNFLPIFFQRSFGYGGHPSALVPFSPQQMPTLRQPLLPSFGQDFCSGQQPPSISTLFNVPFQQHTNSSGYTANHEFLHRRKPYSRGKRGRPFGRRQPASLPPINIHGIHSDPPELSPQIFTNVNGNHINLPLNVSADYEPPLTPNISFISSPTRSVASYNIISNVKVESELSPNSSVITPTDAPLTVNSGYHTEHTGTNNISPKETSEISKRQRCYSDVSSVGDNLEAITSSGEMDSDDGTDLDENDTPSTTSTDVGNNNSWKSSPGTETMQIDGLYPPHFPLFESSASPVTEPAESPVKLPRRRGRPPGSKTLTRPLKHCDIIPGIKSNHLWRFLLELLEDPNDYSDLLRWLDRPQGVFKILNSGVVARMWGERKKNVKMTYDKFSRSIRQYYKKGVIIKTKPSKLIYQFGPQYFDPSD